MKNIEDFILHFNRDNMEYSSEIKLRKISKNLSLKMRLKIKVSKFFYAYLANYILLRPCMTPFSQTCVLLFEEMLMGSIANISQGNQTDTEFLLFILVICQEIYMEHFYFRHKSFSEKFLKFFRKLNFLYNKNLWVELFEILSEQALSRKTLFYFFDPHSARASSFYSKAFLARRKS